jgi:hypothetical protein
MRRRPILHPLSQGSRIKDPFTQVSVVPHALATFRPLAAIHIGDVATGAAVHGVVLAAAESVDAVIAGSCDNVYGRERGYER